MERSKCGSRCRHTSSQTAGRQPGVVTPVFMRGGHLPEIVGFGKPSESLAPGNKHLPHTNGKQGCEERQTRDYQTTDPTRNFNVWP